MLLLLLLVLGGFKTKTTSWAHFRRRSRPRPRSKNQPGPVVLVVLYNTLHTTAATTHSYGCCFIGVHRRRPSQHQQLTQLSSSPALVFPPLLPSRPMKIGTIFVSPLPLGGTTFSSSASTYLFPNHTAVGKSTSKSSSLVNHFLFFFHRYLLLDSGLLVCTCKQKIHYFPLNFHDYFT